MKFQKLPLDVQNKLESSNCIVDATQCISELIFNALDAGASSIAVRVNLQTFYIQVVDNGCGISSTNLEMIGQRYMTNKCSNLKDLERVLPTYGFRGISLASILEMCDSLEIQTKHEGSPHTYTKVMTKSRTAKITQCEKSRACKGTTVTITNFFSNMPVRRKRMKEVFDLEDIKLCIQAIVLINPHVSFSMRNDATGKILLQTSRQRNGITLTEMFCSENDCSKTLLLDLDYEAHPYIVTGFISRALHTNNTLQLLYVNGRIVSRCKVHRLVCNMLVRNGRTWFADELESADADRVVYVIKIQCPYILCTFLKNGRKTTAEFQDLNYVLKLVYLSVKAVFAKNEISLAPSSSSRKGGAVATATAAPVTKIQRINGNPSFGTSQLTNAVHGKMIVRKRTFGQLDTESVQQQYKKQFFLEQSVEGTGLAVNAPIFEIKDFPQVSFHEFLAWLHVKAQRDSLAHTLLQEFLAFKSIQNAPQLNSVPNNKPQRLLSIREARREKYKLSRNKEVNITDDNFERPLEWPFSASTWNSHCKKRDKHLTTTTTTTTNCSPTASNNQLHTQQEKERKMQNSPTLGFQQNPPRQTNTIPPQSVQFAANPFDFYNAPSCFFPEQTYTSPYFNNVDHTHSFANLQTQHNNETIQDETSENFAAAQKHHYKLLLPHVPNVDHSQHSEPTQQQTPLNGNDFVTQKPNEELNLTNSNGHFQALEIPVFYQTKLSLDHPHIQIEQIKNTPAVKNATVQTSSNKLRDNAVQTTLSLKKHYVRSEVTQTEPITFREMSTQTREAENVECLDNLENYSSFLAQIEQENASLMEELKSKNYMNPSDTVPDNSSLIENCVGIEWTEVNRGDSSNQSFFANSSGFSMFHPPTSSTAIKFTMKDEKSSEEVPHLTRSEQETLQSVWRKSHTESIKWINESGENTKPNIPRSLLDEMKNKIEENQEQFQARLPTTALKKPQTVIHKFLSSFNLTGENLVNCKVIGQVDKKFIAAVFTNIANSNSRILVLFDQHAVHERVLLESLYKEFRQNDKFLQIILYPGFTLTIDDVTINLFIAFKEQFTNNGLDLEIFDSNAVLVKSVPACFIRNKGKVDEEDNSKVKKLTAELIQEISDYLRETRGVPLNNPKTISNYLSLLACKGAIKFNQVLSIDEMSELMVKLQSSQLPFQCAHGRPTCVPLLNLDELE